MAISNDRFADRQQKDEGHVDGHGAGNDGVLQSPDKHDIPLVRKELAFSEKCLCK
jgi:hypothetical protein